jgi:nucleoid-associated protein YgaU
MARETRIGLLVAMVFIITFGLVLSELTGRPSPAGKQIRSAIERASHSQYAPIVSLLPDQQPAPPPTGEEPLQLAEAPAGTGEALTLAARMPATIDVSMVQPVQPPSGAEVSLRFHVPPKGPKRGETYVIQPGDSLGRIAREHYGDEGRYLAIYEANKDVLADPSLVVVGQEIVLPKLDVSPVVLASSPSIPPVGPVAASGRRPAPALGELPVVPPPNAGGTTEMGLDQLAGHFGAPGVSGTRKPSGRVYVVRDGDNLTQIARKMLKDDSPQAVNRLFEANRDRLKSPDALLVGQQLNIPT